METSFGIDIGGSGIKGAIVDLNTGDFVSERIKIATPQPATPQAVAETVAAIVQRAGWTGPVGITVPSVVKDQRVLTAANIDKSWIDTNAFELFRSTLGLNRRISVLNDADAAGLAEATFGSPQATAGAVIFLTLGTGIGSAFLLDGKLWPNTELGHMIVGRHEAEHLASSAAKERDDLSFKKWGARLAKVLHHYEALFTPTAFIVGGGISRKYEKWARYVEVSTPIYPAQLRNRAGIVGAAMAAASDIAP
ncbi:MAG: ROK family protein [Corynebacterium sp.]|nr:ROK family protein [Corynebacterium sp.]